jgi:hypothetical protein
LKKLIGVLLAVLLIATACASLPKQVKEAKSFAEKGFIVKQNLRYEVKEYNFGAVVGGKPAPGGSFYNVRLEVSNVGSAKDTIPGAKIYLESQGVKLKPDAELDKSANPSPMLNAILEPGQKNTVWLVFKTKAMPVKVKLYIADSSIAIE